MAGSPVIIKPENVLQYLPLQGNAVAKIGANGTLINSPSFVDGKIGKCANLSNTINSPTPNITGKLISNDSLMTPNNNFTISALVYPVVNVNNAYLGIFGAGIIGSSTYLNGPCLRLYTTTGVIDVIAADVAAQSSAAGAFSVNKWQRITWSYLGGTRSLVMVDNVKVIDLTTTLALTSRRALWGIYKADTGGLFQLFNGYMSHCILWNTSLTEKEIVAMNNSTKGAYIL